MKKSRVIFFGFIVFIILLALFSLIRKLEHLKEIKPPKTYKPVVEVRKVEKGTLAQEEYFLGEYEPALNAVIFPRFSAFVTYIKNEGDNVKKGEVIAKLDDQDIISNIKALNFNKKALESEITGLKSSIESSKINYINAQKNYIRYRELYEHQGVSKQTLEKFEDELKNAQANYLNNMSRLSSLEENIKAISAQIEASSDNLKYAEITAPFNGTILKKYVNLGDTALANHPILEIGNLKGPFYIYVDIPAILTQKVSIGDEETVVVNKKTYKAKLISIIMSSQNNMAKLKLLIDKSLNLPSHTYVKVGVKIGKCIGYIVPKNSIVRLKNKTYVVEIMDNKALWKNVKLESISNDKACVNGSLSSNKVAIGEESDLINIPNNSKVIIYKGN